MTALPFAGVLDTAGEEVGSFLSHLVGALVLLVIGLLVAKLVGGMTQTSASMATKLFSSKCLGSTTVE